MRNLQGISEKNPECPVCDPVLNTLAHHLPFAHCSQSRLVCHMSGSALNENNQPMMLPNGKGRVQKYMLGKLVDFSIKWVNGVPLVH